MPRPPGDGPRAEATAAHDRTLPDPVARAAQVAIAGLTGTITAEELAAAAGDADARVRAAAVAAAVRAGDVAQLTEWIGRAACDDEAAVRRRAAESVPAAVARGAPAPDVAAMLTRLLDDRDVTVVEAAAWALGELGDPATPAVPTLARVATDHRDPLAREAAVAALGALGDRRGLPALLVACRDRPAVRRRAVLALAPFDGPEVDAAIALAREDRDWQVREAADEVAGR